MEIKLTGNKSETVKKLIFDMLEILVEVGIPMENFTDRRKEKIAEACLAVGGITEKLAEAKSDGSFLRTRDIIEFENANYGENRSPGSYDDVRRQDLVLLVEANVVQNSASLSGKATNDPSRGYALNGEFSTLLRTFGTERWAENLETYRKNALLLKQKLEIERNLRKVPVTLPSGERLELTYGEHNDLQKAIVEDFLPRFGFGAQILYLGDTADKFLYMDREKLEKIGFFKLEHDELPDVVAYSSEKNLLYLVEAVHSAGPMSDIRVLKLKRQLKDCTAEHSTSSETRSVSELVRQLRQDAVAILNVRFRKTEVSENVHCSSLHFWTKRRSKSGATASRGKPKCG